MPNIDEHRKKSKRQCGYELRYLHEWIDSMVKAWGPFHQKFRHGIDKRTLDEVDGLFPDELPEERKWFRQEFIQHISDDIAEHKRKERKTNLKRSRFSYLISLPFLKSGSNQVSVGDALLSFCKHANEELDKENIKKLEEDRKHFVGDIQALLGDLYNRYLINEAKPHSQTYKTTSEIIKLLKKYRKTPEEFMNDILSNHKLDHYRYRKEHPK